jgi:hypothetical protein
MLPPEGFPPTPRYCLSALLALVAGVLAGPAVAAAEPPEGQIDAFGGTGVAGYTGDFAAAANARMTGPTDVAVMPDGSVLIATPSNNVVRKVDPSGIITTVAGDGGTCGNPAAGQCGDGEQATAAQLNAPGGVASTGDGGFLIADTGDRRIRRVRPDGVIEAAAGSGADCVSPFACGDGSDPALAAFNQPGDVAVTADGGYLIADFGVNVVRKVNATETGIERVAGNYEVAGSFGGEGVVATGATVHLNNPYSVAPTPDGGFLIADQSNHRIRRVTAGAPSVATISTFAGTGTPCDTATTSCGDGADPLGAQLTLPKGVAARADGAVYIGDTGDNKVRRVDGTGITTIAGDGNPCTPSTALCGDGGPATSAQLNEPWGLAQCGNSLLIADSASNRVRWMGLPRIAGAAPCVPPPPPTPPPPAPVTTTETTTPPVITEPPPLPLVIGPPPPELGRSVVATVLIGTVLVRRPGERVFTPLAASENLPIGTEFDTTHGSVSIEFATGPGELHSTEVSRGPTRRVSTPSASARRIRHSALRGTTPPTETTSAAARPGRSPASGLGRGTGCRTPPPRAGRG